MEKKYLIQQQYFDLSEYLNESNEVQNKIKEMYFYTIYNGQEEFLFAAVSNWQQKSVCKKLKYNHWVGLGDSKYEELEKEIAMHLPTWLLSQTDLTKCIRKHILGPFT